MFKHLESFEYALVYIMSMLVFSVMGACHARPIVMDYLMRMRYRFPDDTNYFVLWNIARCAPHRNQKCQSIYLLLVLEETNNGCPDLRRIFKFLLGVGVGWGY